MPQACRLTLKVYDVLGREVSTLVDGMLGAGEYRAAFDASALASGVWTVGYTARWVLACSLLVLSVSMLGADSIADGEKIMPLVLGKFPVVDVEVELYDGKYHDVDSSELSFKIASRTAFKMGMEKAGPQLLEPAIAEDQGKIVSVFPLATGIPVAGSVALGLAQADRDRLARAAEALKAQPQEIDAKIAQVVENARVLEKEVARLKAELARGKLDDVLAMGMRTINGVKAIAVVLDGADAGMLRESLDRVKEKLGSGVALLATVADGKVSLIAGVTKDLTAKVKAGDLVNFVAQQVGGKGGGRADLAMAGGTDATALPKALASVRAWAEARL